MNLSKINGIYAITDGDLRPDRTHACIASCAVEGGATVVQLRAKDLATDEFIEMAVAVRRITAQAGALLIVNDRIDVAVAVGADGAHIGPSDISPSDARAVLGPDRILGVSVASVEEGATALPYASYFGVGAVFGTGTKADAGAPIGTHRLRLMQEAFPQIPIIAIGGINCSNLLSVRQTGVAGAAVISAIVSAENMTATTRVLVELWASYSETTSSAGGQATLSTSTGS